MKLIRLILLAGLLLGAGPALADCVYNATTPALTDGTKTFTTCDTSGAAFVNAEGQKATYSATSLALVPQAAATDIFCITGSATKTVRVVRIQISGIATAATSEDIVVLKRSTANTAGTSTAPTLVAMDSTQSAASATVLAYTANNTPGTLVGNVRGAKLPLGTATAPAAQGAVFDFSTDAAKSLVLRGITQVACLNWNGATTAGNSVNVDIEWTEE